MFIERRIERHQLPSCLKVFNRFTDKPVGFLGNLSADGLMLISQLPMLVGAEFELRVKVPLGGGQVQLVDFNACCLWCHEDLTPHQYDSGFSLRRVPPELAELEQALRHYFSFHPLQTSA
ncbi:PilZ domain-containing protein [Pseudomonas sp. NFXW11]|uniref:PilZ domain-containing protein n=1 Tax=Pseudomonas sp. NFXW11 TaxID=2819531 RepID=UPI003CE9C8CD